MTFPQKLKDKKAEEKGVQQVVACKPVKTISAQENRADIVVD